MSPCRRERGFTLIGLLIVLVIIFILTNEGYFASTKKTQSTYQMSMSRANKAACDLNRNAFQTNIQMWHINNPDKPITLENIKASPQPMVIPACPGGGVISVGPNGEVYCSIHNPAPGAETTGDTAGEAAAAQQVQDALGPLGKSSGTFGM